MPVNSRQKGKRGERLAAAYLTSLGFPARRGVQYAGSAESPDVVVDNLPGVHIEVKNTATIELGTVELDDAIAQAGVDAGRNKEPVVLWRRTRTAWRLTWLERGVQLTTTGDAEIAATLRRMNSAQPADQAISPHSGVLEPIRMGAPALARARGGDPPAESPTSTPDDGAAT
jgi:Holliday junction resolvase